MLLPLPRFYELFDDQSIAKPLVDLLLLPYDKTVVTDRDKTVTGLTEEAVRLATELANAMNVSFRGTSHEVEELRRMADETLWDHELLAA